MRRGKVKAKSDRYKKHSGAEETLQSKWKAISLGGRLFLLSTVAIFLCLRILNDTISVRYFGLIYGSVGLVVYFIVKLILKRNASIKLDAWGYPGSFLLATAAFAFLNFVTLSSTIKIQSVLITEKSFAGSGRSLSRDIFFNSDKKQQRFTIHKKLWGSIRQGELVNMHYQESLLGFDIVDHFENQ